MYKAFNDAAPSLLHAALGSLQQIARYPYPARNGTRGSLEAINFLTHPNRVMTLSLLIPPLLVMFADPASLEYEGGAANVGMLDITRTTIYANM